MVATTQGPRPPRYPTEGFLPERTDENDKAALKLAQLACDLLLKGHTGPEKRRNPWKPNTGDDEYAMFDDQGARDQYCLSSSEGSASSFYTGLGQSSTNRRGKRKRIYREKTQSPRTHRFQPSPEVRLPLRSMYDGTGAWPKCDLHTGAEQPSWANIGFPRDESLVIEDFTGGPAYVDTRRTHIHQISQSLGEIKTQDAKSIADDGIVDTEVKNNRTIEKFQMYDGSWKVCKVTFSDCKVSQSSYSTCMTSREIEKQITREIGKQPPLGTVQWVAAHVILAQAGQLGGRSQDYWIKARDLAQQQLHIVPDLERAARMEMYEDMDDPAFAAMLAIVKKCIKDDPFNPYFQSKRDKHAVERNLFTSIWGQTLGKYLKLGHLGRPWSSPTALTD